MLRWRGPFCFSLRLLQTQTVKTEPLLDQLKKCSTEYQVFQLLGMNRSALSVHHVGYAVNLLWYFQEGKPETCRTLGQIRDHPEFIALRTLARDNVDLLDDKELVDVLYNLMMFQVQAHDAVIQRLVVEGWRRLERLDLPTLAKFAVCLKKQDLTTSPLIGHMASVVDRDLEDADDPVTLSCLLVCLQSVSSPNLQERLVEKTESVIQKFELSDVRHAFRVMRLFYKYKFTYVSLLEKYDNVFKQHIGAMDAKDLSSIAGVYKHLRLNNTDFPVMAKPRLVEMMKMCNDPETFVDLFDALSRMVSHHMRDGLEEKLLTFSDEMNLSHLLVVLRAMVEMDCTNNALIQKICSLLQQHLDICKPTQLLHMTESVVNLPHQNTKLLKELQRHLQRNLIASFIPSEVARMAKALSLLNLNQVDEAVLSKIDAIIQQCNLPSMEKIAVLLMQLSKTPRSFGNHHKTYRELLQKLKSCALGRLQQVDSLDLLLDEIMQIKSRQWMNGELAEGVLDACQRLLHKVTWRNVTKLSICLMQMNVARAPFLHTIAAVTMEDITKIHPSCILIVLRPFAFLNYEPPQGREFFNICLQHVMERKDSLSPSCLIQICYSFALVKQFPKELINAVFDIKFLGQLDAQLASFPHAQSMSLRYYLMELNRAVCIEHPEYQVPWFHDPYCQHLKRKEVTSMNQLLQELLEEILGGKHYTKVSVTAPYGYSIDFEFTLDKDKEPMPYPEQDGVYEGTQRFAVELLSPKAFCQNTHLKGQFAMKKRHLEILGYHVIQIPSYEWKSLTVSERENQIQYLRKKIFVNH
ncbi:FAST kinase domain-containing protein 1, mitochondrial-like [Bufo gargarizans]|uniref:FAST kinase domain-containing protein 1, mitochondrial-like n=1 Tax=Bufo gargarizans TaxID=30331 RepID=UPI001CF321B8|nr:FAST kinase domain-containing protein 1, mitochondrial-like [Bufo gargarizans]XP_044158471.1 FAST kinase domain-containing protein 1, mitochondrial-like [Bufo gargarizans]XP_044158472.1 FAST kinase domain-containing protein 1, mitochondrial-like [Bufo gargarizans]XP_044158474.1 FAST kinase domain-containing protein 1, mitochondrial-like [Bufo gargarizans]XP_044158475.1 FAST kinase domain-containing protein 1, mitochondrial-like [Bufo gargarizans]